MESDSPCAESNHGLHRWSPSCRGFLEDIVRVVSHNHFGFIVLRRIRIELGITCSTAEILRHLEPEAGLGDRVVINGNPILRPVENV